LIEVFRIVEDQSGSYALEATGNSAGLAKQLEILFQKPTEVARKKLLAWHKLIRAPFLYPLPVGLQYQARFKPPMSNRNIFYGAAEEETAFYEFAHHFVKERIHLTSAEACNRTCFSAELDSKNQVRVHSHPNISQIMDPFDYAPSHSYIIQNSKIDLICYPSCRDINARDCYAVLNINHLGYHPKSTKNLTVNWDATKKILTCMELNLNISYQVNLFSKPTAGKSKQKVKRASKAVKVSSGSTKPNKKKMKRVRKP
jgi:hypothetical protein